MNFNDHTKLLGCHAFLSASKYSWLGYDAEKMEAAYKKYLAIERGTRLHALAKNCIELGVKLPKTQTAMNQFVNDAIGFRMVPEQVLFYSLNAFGTADAISYHDDVLRIHDLKTGSSPVYMHQLEIYAALFCLEYGINPLKLQSELRIYQGSDIIVHQPEGSAIFEITDKIITFDKQLEQLKMEAGL